MIRLKGQIPHIRRQGAIQIVGDEPLSPYHGHVGESTNYYFTVMETWDGNTDGVTYNETYGLYKLSDTEYSADKLFGAKIELSNGKTYVIPNSGGRFGENCELTFSIVETYAEWGYYGKAYVKTIDGETIFAIDGGSISFGYLMVGITSNGTYLKSISFAKEVVWETLFEGDLTGTGGSGERPPKAYNFWKCVEEDGFGEDYGEDQYTPSFYGPLIGEFPRSIMFKNVRLTVDGESISCVPKNAKVKYKGTWEGAIYGYNPFMMLYYYTYLRESDYMMLRTFPTTSGVNLYTQIVGTKHVKLEAQVYDTPLLVGCKIGEFVTPEFPEWDETEHPYAFAVAVESSTAEDYVIYLVATKEARHISTITDATTGETAYSRIAPVADGDVVGDILAWRSDASYCEWVGQGPSHSIAAAELKAALYFPIYDLPFAEGYDRQTSYKVIWSNYDILDPDGNVYFAKSTDPVLVYE